MKNLLVILFATISLVSCDAINQIYGPGEFGKPNQLEIEDGLKEALVQGIKTGAYSAGKRDGYLTNNLIKIPWPEDARKVKATLITIGLEEQVNEVETSINRAAEQAASASVDLFKTAISQLTFQDVVDIISGDDDAATNYLKRVTSVELTERFTPIIDSALSDVNATRYWTDVITVYNDLPTTFTKVNPELTPFVTEKAIDGLFVLIAQEEAKIRKDPIARTTDLMKKVFGYYQQRY